MNQPILSVIMTNFNHARFLSKRISSLLSAMPQNAELIIGDDGSSDDSVTIIERFALQNARIRFHKNPYNLGVVKSLNTITPMARGKYITFQSADDDILPAFFSRTIDVLEKHPSIGLCCSIPAILHDFGSEKNPSNIIAIPPIDDIHQPTAFPAEMIVNVFRTTNFWVAGHTTILRRELLDQYGEFDERIGPYSDWLLWHSIALKEGAVYIPETLAIWKIFNNSYSSLTDERPYVQAMFDKINTDLQAIKSLFRQSLILRRYLKPNLCWILFKPQYWEYLSPLVSDYLRRRWKKLLQK